MWQTGKIGCFTYQAKVYDAPSVYGINEGRVSKLELRLNGAVVANYDRGWDIDPTSPAVAFAVDLLLKQYT
jgi:hypothetical protein